MIAFIFYVLPTIICLFSTYLMCTKGMAVSYKKVAVFWSDFPFGQGFPLAGFFGGFAFFPVINFIIACSVIFYIFYKLDKMNMKFSEIWGDLE